MRKHNVNPILKKEIKVGARSVRLPIAVSVYAFVMSLISFVVLASIAAFRQEYSSSINMFYYSGGVDYSQLAGSFFPLTYVQFAIICLIIPIQTASSIAGERERQTLDIMLTAPISPLTIVWGKLGSAMAQILLFVVGSLPAMSLCFLYGGIRWYYLLIFMIQIIGLGFFAGAIGVWCSSVFKKTVGAVIMTLIMECVFFLAPIFLFSTAMSAKYSLLVNINGPSAMTTDISVGMLPLILLLDPIISLVDMSTMAYSGGGIVEGIVNDFGVGDALKMSGVVKFISPVWGIIGYVIMLLIGFFFMWMAVRSIDKVRIRGKRIK